MNIAIFIESKFRMHINWYMYIWKELEKKRISGIFDNCMKTTLI